MGTAVKNDVEFHLEFRETLLLTRFSLTFAFGSELAYLCLGDIIFDQGSQVTFISSDSGWPFSNRRRKKNVAVKVMAFLTYKRLAKKC